MLYHPFFYRMELHMIHKYCNLQLHIASIYLWMQPINIHKPLRNLLPFLSSTEQQIMFMKMKFFQDALRFLISSPVKVADIKQVPIARKLCDY